MAETLNPANQALFKLLLENRDKEVTAAQILKVTKWSESTWKTHHSKNVYAPYLRDEPGKAATYFVTAPADLDEATFRRRISQNHGAKELGAHLDEPLARALVRKARDNMTLALELYNRPSLENRLDGFCVLFCIAWEQLLKAELIEEFGVEKNYRATKPGKRQETISLEEALKVTLEEADPVRKNVAQIAEFRHEATHLLMREAQSVFSRPFQPGILNFAKRFAQVTEFPLFPRGSVGLMSLIGDTETEPDVIGLQQTYGNTPGSEIAALIKSLSHAIASENALEFAIPIDVKLVLTKKEQEGDIKLVPSDSATHALAVVHKPVSIEKLYPFRAKEAVGAITKGSGKEFTTHALLAIRHHEKWDKGNNEHHHELKHPVSYHVYSQKAVDFCIEKLKTDASYVAKALASYSASHKKKKSKAKV